MALLFFMILLGSWQGQSSQGLGNWKADQRVSEVEENNMERLCPLGHKSSKMVRPSSWTNYTPFLISGATQVKLSQGGRHSPGNSHSSTLHIVVLCFKLSCHKTELWYQFLSVFEGSPHFLYFLGIHLTLLWEVFNALVNCILLSLALFSKLVILI